MFEKGFLQDVSLKVGNAECRNGFQICCRLYEVCTIKLSRVEFQNYIHSYETDEIFYRDLYFAQKNHPETFTEYCQGLDRNLITSHRRIWKKMICSRILKEILYFANIIVILLYFPMNMNFLKSCVCMMELSIPLYRGFPMYCIQEISVLYHLIPSTVWGFLMTVLQLIFWFVALRSSLLFSRPLQRTARWHSFLHMYCIIKQRGIS